MAEPIDTNYQNVEYKPVNITTGDKNLPTNLSIPGINSPALDQGVSIGASTNSADLIVQSATRVFVTPAQKSVLAATSGSNTGDETKTSVATKLVTTGATAPGTTPSVVGERFLNTTGKKAYVSMGTSSSADWILVN